MTKTILGALANKAPVPYVSRRLGGLAGGLVNNAESQMKAMSSVGTLFSIVHRTSNATSHVDWKLWRDQADRRRRFGPTEDRRLEVQSHAALDVWNKPNKFMTRQFLVESVQQHVDLVGEGCIVAYRDPRSPLPLELWPVRPDRITPIPGVEEFIVGYIYTGPDGDQIPLEVADVGRILMPNPLDPYRGLGPVQAALVDIDSARYSAEWNRSFFVNSALPGGIIEFPTQLDDNQWREFVDRWREQHQGIAQAHRVAVLEGATWKDSTLSQRDMQFVQLRGVSRELIREAFGIHGHVIGISQDINKANAEAGEISFARWDVRTRADRFKQLLNHWLLPAYGDPTLVFDHDRVVPDDREADDRERNSKAEAAATLVTAGFDPSAVLATVGLPDIPYVGPPAPAAQPAQPAPAE